MSAERVAVELHATDAETSARLGRLVTPHAVVDTPVFMPVGTASSVKSVTFEQGWET